MAEDHHSPVAGQLNQNDVTPVAHYQHRGATLRRRKIQTLITAVNFIPFRPKLLIQQNQESVLKQLGLHNFGKMKLDQSIRPDLIAQVIANYDPKKRCSSVNGKRVRVSRADLARALELPIGKQDGLGVFSDEEIEFVDDFVFNWMLIHEESWVMPEKIVRMTRCVREGHPEKLDAASLIWYKVERELGLGVKLVDCYYASHLQRLLRSQCELLFEVDEEHMHKVSDVELSLGHETVDSKNNLDEQLLQRCQTSGLSNNEQVKVEEDGECIEKVSIVQDDDAELALGHATMDDQVDLHNNLGEQLLQCCHPNDLNNNKEVGDVVDEQVVQVEDDEVKEDEEHIEKVSDVQLSLAHDVEFTLGHEAVDSKNNSGEQLLQHCQISDLNNNEAKVEDVVDQHIVQVEDGEGKEVEDDGVHMEKVFTVQELKVQLTLGHQNVDQLVDSKKNSGEQFLQQSKTSDLNNEDVVDKQILKVGDDNDDGEMFVEDLDMEVNDDAIDIVGSRDDSFSAHGGPSVFDNNNSNNNNNGKRVMGSEDDTHYLDMNNKRLKTNDICDHNQSEFGL